MAEFEFRMFAERNEVFTKDAFDSQIGKRVTDGDEATTIIAATVAGDGKSVLIRAKTNRNLNRDNDLAMEAYSIAPEQRSPSLIQRRTRTGLRGSRGVE